jgi:MFS family permease
MMAVAFLALPYPSTVEILIIPLIFSAIGRAISQPAMLSLVSLEATPSTRGAVMGSFQSAASAARTIGPLAAGFLFDWNDALPFLFAGVLMVMTIPLCLRMPKSAATGA